MAIQPEEALARAVDPVTEAAKYQQLLVGLVGEHDPAAIQGEHPDQLAWLLADAGESLRTHPEPAEWSVLECAGHLVDAEIVVSGRYRWTLAQDEPDIIGYDQDLWVRRLQHQQDDPGELVSVFRALRRANLDLWRRTPEAERSRVAVHRERGPESYELTFRMIAGHGILHLDQARRTLDSLRTS